jgi:ParB/RepB/Spo0J family partition protein
LPLTLPSDFAVKIAELLNWKLAGVDEWFEFSEDKEGYFWAKLRPKKFLEKPDWLAVNKLTRDLGGEDFLDGGRAWKVPGSLAKKPSEHGIDSEPKGQKKELESSPLIIKVGYYEHFPLAAILSPIFTLRLHIEENIKELVEQIATTRASGEQAIVLEPIVCRPATKAGYVEVAAGERRLLASRMLGLGNIPVILKDMSDEEFDRIRLMENFARKDLSDYEVGRALQYLLEKYPAVYPTQANIADVFGKSQQWVSQRLQMLKPELETITTRVVLESGKLTEHQAREILAAPEEKHEQILDKINETGQVPSAREIHEIAHPRIPCARCGEPIEGTPVHLGEGKFYDAECAEQVVAESKPSALQEEHVGPFEEGERKPEEEEEKEEEKRCFPKPTEPEMHVTEGTSYDVADFTCPQCKQSFRIVHLPSGKHSFKLVREHA